MKKLSKQLIEAAEEWNLKKVKELVKQGADVNAVDHCGGTALTYAAIGDNLDIVKYLIEEHGADVNAVDEWGRTVLMYAAEKGNLDMVKYLIEHGEEEMKKLIEENTKRQLSVLKRRGEQFVSEEIKDWEKKNSRNIENVHKAKLLEEFMGEFQGVLSKFYMDKPTLNKLESLQLENKNLTRRIKTLSNESRIYKQAKLEEAKEQKIEKATKNLSQVEKEKITMILKELDEGSTPTKRKRFFERAKDVSLIKNDKLRRKKITEGKKLFEERRKKHNILKETRKSNEIDKPEMKKST